MAGEREYFAVDGHEILKELREVAVNVATIKADTHTMSRVLDGQVTGLTDVTNRQTKLEGRMERVEGDYNAAKTNRKDSVTLAIAIFAALISGLSFLAQVFHWGGK